MTSLPRKFPTFWLHTMRFVHWISPCRLQPEQPQTKNSSLTFISNKIFILFYLIFSKNTSIRFRSSLPMTSTCTDLSAFVINLRPLIGMLHDFDWSFFKSRRDSNHLNAGRCKSNTLRTPHDHSRMTPSLPRIQIQKRTGHLYGSGIFQDGILSPGLLPLDFSGWGCAVTP